MHGGVSGPVGYVITFLHFTPDRAPIRVYGATLTDDAGRDVPFFLNTPANDDFLPYGALVIPQRPLKPNARYSVSVAASTDDGRNISRRWSFTTGGAPPRIPPIQDVATLAPARASGGEA